MALRYLARRAFEQRALVPRVPPSAGSSRPVSTVGSSPPQGLLTNESKAAASKGNKEPELLGRDFSKLIHEQIRQKLHKVGSIYKAVNEEAILDSWWGFMGAVAVGAGLAFIQNSYGNRNERIIITLS